MIEAIGGRKVMVSLLIILIGVGVTLTKGDIPINLLHLLELIGGSFIAGNVISDGLASKGGADDIKASLATIQEVLVNLAGRVVGK